MAKSSHIFVQPQNGLYYYAMQEKSLVFPYPSLLSALLEQISTEPICPTRKEMEFLLLEKFNYYYFHSNVVEG